MRVRVDLGALQANTGTADSDGVVWRVGDKLEGWDSPEVEPSVAGVTGHHGSALLGSQYPRRVIVLPGSASAPTPEACWAAHARLSGLVGLITPVALTVYETVPKSVQVVKGGRPRIALRPGLTGLDWSLSLLALDPFKKGATHSVTLAAGASTTITYAGTWPGSPTVTANAVGSVDVRVPTTGTQVLTAPVPSGTEIVSAEPGHTVYSGATNMYSSLVQPVAWLRLQPGANTVTNAGTAPVTLTYSDLYL